MRGEPRNEAFMTHAMDTWADTVYRVALSHMRSPHDAEDITQDVFIRLLKSGTQFAGDEHLKAWLLSVTVNRCREMRRSAWQRRELPCEFTANGFDNGALGVATGARTPGTAPSPEETCLFDHPIWEAMDKLPDDMRTAVHLHYVEGCSTDEVARIMNANPSTVRSWLHRARKQLKTTLEGRGGGRSGERADASCRASSLRATRANDPPRIVATRTSTCPSHNS